jgi:hypothetical protein
VYAARSHLLTRPEQLVAAGQEMDARAAVALDPIEAEGSDDAELGRADPGPGSEDRLSRLDVLPGAADVAARLDLGFDKHPVPVLSGVLDADHGVGAVRDHRAG